ncbi:MAG: tyrosine-type recombinase/integrase [bacterium]|nr:tyrosine-type recombinase/integrase [bacterium]
MKYGIEPTLKRTEEELKLADYSPATVRTYHSATRRFLYHALKPSNQLTHDDVRRYILYMTEEGYSGSSINQHHFAIRFLFQKVLKKEGFRLEQPLHKRPKKVPVVLAREEVDLLFEAATDLGYQTIWMVLYSSGLRLSEAARLRVSDIDSKSMQLLVRNGKGRKDRYTVLSKSLLGQLRTYYRAYRPEEWLFYGRDKQHPPVLRTLQKVFKEDKRRAGIRKKATRTACDMLLPRTRWKTVPICFTFVTCSDTGRSNPR